MNSPDILTEKNPESLFSIWLAEARAHAGIREPTAMVLATVDGQGRPSTRTVLLKDRRATDFLFFTNYRSHKGLDLAANPHCSATFYWDPLFKQIHVHGSARASTRQVSEDYWRTRPRESQLSQWVSQQSQQLAVNVSLQELTDQARRQWDGRDIPCPEHWGGFWIEAQEIEFWIGDRYRLHQRFLFAKAATGAWSVGQYYP